MPRPTTLLVLLLFALLIAGLAALSAPTPVPVARAAASDVAHCTDWPAASIRDTTSGSDQDQAITTYMPSANVQVAPGGPAIPMTPSMTPTGPDWRVLVRPGQPFAVFYTEVGLADGIRDVPSSTAPNYDLDGDHVPDYAERIYSCLQAAHTRYKAYYNLASATEQNYFGWLKLDYADPLTPTTQLHGAFYPIIIRDEPHRGQVLPFLVPLQSGPYPATFNVW